MKCTFTSICLVLEWNTGFEDKELASRLFDHYIQGFEKFGPLVAKPYHFRIGLGKSLVLSIPMPYVIAMTIIVRI